MSYNFNAKRFVTRGINERVSPEVQGILWSLLDEQVNNEEKMDYIQFYHFEMILIEGRPTQKIVQRQEQPERSVTVHYQNIEDMITSLTVWIIDDGEDGHVTMLLPSEY